MNTNKFRLGVVYQTADYSLFNGNVENRPLHDDPILLESLRKYGFWRGAPIICTKNESGDLVLEAGHHRLHYAKILKIPVWFIVDEKPIPLYEREASSKVRWSSQDFVVSLAKGGNPEFKALLAYQKKHRLTLGAAAHLLGGYTADCEGSQVLLKIKRGTWKRGDPKHGEQVLAILDACETRGLEFSRSSSFVKTISHVLRIPELNYEQLLQRVKVHGASLQKRATYQDYLLEIETLYNRGSLFRSRVPVALRAHQVGLKRAATFGRES